MNAVLEEAPVAVAAVPMGGRYGRMVAHARELRANGAATAEEILEGLVALNSSAAMVAPLEGDQLRVIAKATIDREEYFDRQRETLEAELSGFRFALAEAAAAIRPRPAPAPRVNPLVDRLLALAAQLQRSGWPRYRVLNAVLALNAAPEGGEWSLSRPETRRLVAGVFAASPAAGRPRHARTEEEAVE